MTRDDSQQQCVSNIIIDPAYGIVHSAAMLTGQSLQIAALLQDHLSVSGTLLQLLLSDLMYVQQCMQAQPT